MRTLFIQKFSKPWNAYYLAGRLVLWCVFVVGILIFAASVLFPSSTFVFDFENAKSKNNTLMNPRIEGGDFRKNGRFNSGETFLVNASVLGDFSDTVVRISENNADGKSALEKSVLSVRRSQKAFFYPEGAPASFPKGTYIRFEKNYFQIAPNGTRKQFPTEESVRSLGLDPSAFLSVSPEEFLANQNGGMLDISDDSLLDGSFIRSDDTYYEWRDGRLIPFVSKESFLARFPDNWAVPKDVSFVRKQTLSETWHGYPSGSLLAWSDGVFLMDRETPRPILGADVFLSLGFSWDDVRPASDEEISLSQKGKFVNSSVPHPDGTVFLDTKEQRYFLIENGRKHEIFGENLLHLWLGNRHPILVSSDSLTKKSSCVLKKSTSLFSSSLTCTMPLGELSYFHGDTYEFSLTTPAETNIQRMNVSFEMSVHQKTLLKTLSKLKERILSRYISAP